MPLLIATTNPGKLREIKDILNWISIELVTLELFPEVPEPEETGETFAENARIKAIYYSEATGLPAVADDSGLEIEAMGNAPGIHSARWQGKDYPTKFAAIRRELDAKGLETSAARFVAHIALAHDGNILFEASGIVQGEIAPEPKGTHGFGYDPIFFYPPYGCTLAEVDGAKKAAASHRGKAFRQLREWLASGQMKM